MFLIKKSVREPTLTGRYHLKNCQDLYGLGIDQLSRFNNLYAYLCQLTMLVRKDGNKVYSVTLYLYSITIVSSIQ
jgi:hypothetical protein